MDFTLPQQFHDGLKMPADGAPGTQGQYLVPLAWLARRQLVNFDLRDGSGRTLLAPSRTALGLTAIALVVAAGPIGLQLDRLTIELAWGLGMFMSLGAFGVIAGTFFDHSTFRAHVVPRN